MHSISSPAFRNLVIFCAVIGTVNIVVGAVGASDGLLPVWVSTSTLTVGGLSTGASLMTLLWLTAFTEPGETYTKRFERWCENHPSSAKVVIQIAGGVGVAVALAAIGATLKLLGV